MALIQGIAAAGYRPGYSAGISFIKRDTSPEKKFN
jgi:hypothetical protein